MKELQLTNGRVSLVDDEDYPELSKYKWYAHKIRNTYYAERAVEEVLGRTIKESIHRRILCAPAGKQVDHVDGDGLNNVRANLRVCSNSENHCNTTKPKSNTSGFKGVYRFQNKYWRATIGKNGKRHSLGYFHSAEEAARAYDEAAKIYHGKFAQLNFPEAQ